MGADGDTARTSGHEWGRGRYYSLMEAPDLHDTLPQPWGRGGLLVVV